LYYGNKQTKILPNLLLIIVLFAALVYYFYRSTKLPPKNKLWAGMAKETASNRNATTSLIGWVEIKADNVEESTTIEIEKTLSQKP
jgi:hypothetical protein